MSSEFVPYETALKLKEIGFNLPCIAWYYIPEIERTGEIILHYTERGKEIQECSTSSMCEQYPEYRRYLKAEHCCNTIQNRSKHIVTAPLYQQVFKWFRKSQPANSYEEAELECIKELIKLANEK